ncbi:MAG TPA: hypothetical protein VMT61_15370 [Candidatus Binataceae bacterium]|nr:hypothetical protein [Candidatus Binataceae bacterium]
MSKYVAQLERGMKSDREWAIWSKALLGLALVAGCSTPGKVPMQVNITPLANYVNPARPPSCKMPVLTTMPLQENYKEVAIVEVWADLQDDKEDVIPMMQRKACETGADAIVIKTSQHQDIKSFLYQASPNETLNEATQKDVYSGQGEYIKTAEHTRRIGEVGHNGYYLEAVAINYVVTPTRSPKASEPKATLPPS